MRWSAMFTPRHTRVCITIDVHGHVSRPFIAENARIYLYCSIAPRVLHFSALVIHAGLLVVGLGECKGHI